MLKTCDISNFDLAFKILKQSFPLTERRDYKGQKNILSNENYKLFALYDNSDTKILGIAGVWALNGVVFIEHLAVEKSCRNMGVGSKILSLLSKEFNKDIICLEVEPANSELQQKRINFYLKNNFYLNDFYYVQPSYGKRYPEIELKIMSMQKALTKQEFVLVVTEIYQKVYKKPLTFLKD